MKNTDPKTDSTPVVNIEIPDEGIEWGVVAKPVQEENEWDNFTNDDMFD